MSTIKDCLNLNNSIDSCVHENKLSSNILILKCFFGKTNHRVKIVSIDYIFLESSKEQYQRL